MPKMLLQIRLSNLFDEIQTYANTIVFNLLRIFIFSVLGVNGHSSFQIAW